MDFNCISKPEIYACYEYLVSLLRKKPNPMYKEYLARVAVAYIPMQYQDLFETLSIQERQYLQLELAQLQKKYGTLDAYLPNKVDHVSSD